MAAEPQAPVQAQLDRLAGTLPALGIAVSGGGDSLALLHIAAAWGRARGIAIHAATVDHDLRPGSAAEADAVARDCAALGVPHTVLRWDHGGAVTGNLMAAARRARMGLLAGWAAGAGLGAVALGHTQDDQAETLLMRLGRGAGIDGLSGMAEARFQADTVWLRPMLGVRRGELRQWLTERGIVWADDPTNEDGTFDRVRARKAIAALDLPVAQLARSAAALAEARAALAETAVAAAAGTGADHGVLRLPEGAMAQPAEIRRRLIVAAIRWITGADYAPRGDDIGRLAATLVQGGQGTLDGVIARMRAGRAEFLREPAAAQPEIDCSHRPAGTVIWDNRWALDGLPDRAVIAATAERDLVGRDWRAAGLPRLALLSAPAIRAGGRVMLPLLGDGAGTAIRALRGADSYIAFLRAH